MPTEIAEIWFDFDWDNQRVWEVDGESIRLPVHECEWLFGLAIWMDFATGAPWSLTPLDVLANPGLSPGHTQRIETADLGQPVAAMTSNGSLLLLDGYHRLARARRDEVPLLPAKLLLRSQISLSRVG